MSTLLKLFIADIKSNFRDRSSVFWRLVFPIIFIVTFGLFNLDQPANSKVFILDLANNTESQKIIKGFENVSFLTLQKNTNLNDLENAKNDLKEEKISFILVLPDTLKELAKAVNTKPPVLPGSTSVVPTPSSFPQVKLQVYYNEANLMTNQLVLSALDQSTTKLNAETAGVQPLFSLDKQALTNKKIRYIDFLTPGILAMGLMNSSILGMAVFLTEYREKKILKRILATPVDRKTFIASQILSRLIIALLQIIVILATARILYNVNVYGDYRAVFAWALGASLLFLLIGFIVSTFARNSASAEAMTQIIAMPMMFLSGVFFSIDTLPKVIQPFVSRLPLAPIITALRKIILNGDSISTTIDQFYLLAAWVVVCLLIAFLRLRAAKE